MTLPVTPPIFPLPGDTYDRQYMISLIRALELTLRELNTAGPLRATRINISDLPTTDVGLAAGDLWNDANTVKVKS